MRAKSLLLTAVLLISGLPAYLGAAETITGRLDMEYEESGLFGPIRAFVEHLDPDSGRTSIVQIVGWDVLPDLPPSFKSGATVTVAVSRDIPTNVPGALLVTRVEVITPAPLRPVSVSARRMAVKSSKSSWGKDLPVLVLRPRLPENCKPGSRVGGGSKEEWKELIAKVSNLQTSCTNGQLSYQEPVVTDYFDIPCTEMGEVDDGCSQAAMQWYLDAVNYAKTNLSINVESFRHVIGDLPMMEGCGIMGRGMFDDNRLYYNSYVAVELHKDFLDEDNVLTIAHEMGHNYGLTHTDRLQLGKNGKLPKGWERHYGTDDSSNIMGYDNVLSCFNLPQSEAIGLASAKRYGPTRLPAGKKINLRLKPLWGPNPQGAVIATGKKGQHDLRIWASYLVTTDSGFKEGNATLLLGAIFNRAVVLDISTTRIPYNTSSVSYSHRVRTMQSGEIFKWPATGLVFKYRGISKDGEHANVWVCRETGQKNCRLRITPPPLGEPVQLRIAALPGNNCLQACDSDDCRLPRDIFSKRLNNVYFASNCSNDSNTLWRPMIHASGFRRYVSVATGECLTAEYGDKFREPLYIYGKDADNWRMALEACQTDESMETRDNPQLFLPTNPERDPEAEPVWLESPVYIPGCERCGDLKTVCAGVGSVQSPYLPKPTADVTYWSVVSTVCSNQDETEFIQEVSPA